MPRTPRICGQRGCLKIATDRGKCPDHAPAPFEGAKARWNSKRPPGWAALRNRVIREALGLCELCGSPGSQVDHVRPVAEGGSWDRTNLRLLCSACHKTKSEEDAKRGRHRRTTGQGPARRATLHRPTQGPRRPQAPR